MCVYNYIYITKYLSRNWLTSVHVYYIISVTSYACFRIFVQMLILMGFTDANSPVFYKYTNTYKCTCLDIKNHEYLLIHINLYVYI